MNQDTTSTESMFVSVAEDIAARLLEAAVWQGDACSWPLPAPLGPGSGANEGASTRPGGPYVYSGSAGIAWFLLRLHGQRPNDDLLRAARGGLRFALADEATRAQARGGYYDGTAGLLPVLLEMAAMDGDGPWLDAATSLGDKLSAGLEHPGAFDLIVGEAGSLLGLLHLHAVTGSSSALGGARALGGALLRQARQEPEGISWDVMHPKVRRNLIGFSHGVGGIAVALLELGRWTGEARYGLAAFEALRYEMSMGRTDEGWWPDLRHNPLAEFLEQGHRNELVDALLADRFEQPTPGDGMCAWCHGAPSVALGRGYVLQASGRVDLDEAIGRAVEVTLQRTAAALQSDRPPGHSLCHGVCGNLDIVLTLGRRLAQPVWVDEALRLARRCVEQREASGDAGSGWVSGHPGQPPALDLMRGEAGIGLFFLRCAVPEVVDCLLPVPPGKAPFASTLIAGLDAETLEGQAQRARRAHAPRSVRALEAHGVTLPTVDATSELPVVLEGAIRKAAKDHLQSADALRDVLSLETAALELWTSQLDVSEPFLASLLRHRPERLEQDGTLVCLAASSRLHRTSHDWEALAEGGGGWPEVAARPTTYLLYVVEQRLRLRRLPPLAAAMYELLRRPIAVGQLYDAMVEKLAAERLVEADDGENVAAVRAKLGQILAHAYRDRMVDIVEPYDLKPGDITSEVCIRCGECCKIKIEIPGDAVYTEFAREMLEEPLREAYPEARVDLVPSPGAPFTRVDLGYCRHLQRGVGDDGHPCLTCGIYQRRPQTCRDFNCVTWWRRQRLGAVGPTTADGVIEKVVQLTGHRRRGTADDPSADPQTKKS